MLFIFCLMENPGYDDNLPDIFITIFWIYLIGENCAWMRGIGKCTKFENILRIMCVNRATSSSIPERYVRFTTVPLKAMPGIENAWDIHHLIFDCGVFMLKGVTGYVCKCSIVDKFFRIYLRHIKRIYVYSQWVWTQSRLSNSYFLVNKFWESVFFNY